TNRKRGRKLVSDLNFRPFPHLPVRPSRAAIVSMALGGGHALHQERLARRVAPARRGGDIRRKPPPGGVTALGCRLPFGGGNGPGLGFLSTASGFELPAPP